MMDLWIRISCGSLFLWQLLHGSSVHALAQPSSGSSSSSSGGSATEASASCSTSNLVDAPKLLAAIHSGRVYQHFDFLSEDEVQWLWTEIRALEANGGFEISGLSNTAQGSNQAFDQQRDRKLCPVPWWVETLKGDKLTTTQASDKEAMQRVASRIQELRTTLSTLLNRPTMLDDALAHECYYSMSATNSFLPRHMDERHEELKGAKGWLLPSRRSLSWLIYVSDPKEWTLEENGGALRTFPQQNVDASAPSAPLTPGDNGNLQIGWLRKDNDNGNSKQSPPQPVYLNSWYPVATPGPSGEEAEQEPHCVLYTRNEKDSEEPILLTRPWLTEALQGISVSDFLSQWSQLQSQDEPTKDGLFLTREYAQQFILIEDRVAWDSGAIPKGTIVEDLIPQRGSLVVFDSVLLPHQVETIKVGKRVALAGWFHEATQAFPTEW